MLEVRLQIRAKLRHFSSSFSSCANSMAQSRLQLPPPVTPRSTASPFPVARSCCIFYAISYFIWIFIFMLFWDPSTFASHSHPPRSLSYCLLGNVLADFIFLVLFNASSFCVLVIYSMKRYLRDWGKPKVFL